MATAVAQKLEFPAEIDTQAPVKAATRAQALELMRSGQNATHEQGVDARIHHAATGLIQGHRAGRKVDIEAYGYPYDVLENVSLKLQSIGASQYMTAQVLNALQDYILNMGSDFSRAAKAKPLYARIMVTNQKPDDLPECEQEQAAFLDGVRKIGGEAARINVQNTVFGTKSTTSQGVDLNTMFASNNNGLFVYFGSPTNQGIGGFDSVDNALVDLAQGMGADIGGAGGGATKQAVEEIKQAIKSGEATPETLKLIENLAGLAKLADAMKTPGAVTNAPAKMMETVRAITQQIQTGVAQGVIPAAVIQGAATVITNMQGNDVIQAVLASPEGAKSLMIVADNDNKAAAPVADLSQEPATATPVAADNDNVTVIAQVQAVTAQLTELAAADSTPPEVRAQLQAQIATILQSVDAPQSVPVQAALAVVAQTLTTIDMPAADAVAAKVETLSAQLSSATPVAQALDVPAAAVVQQLPELATLAAADVKEIVAALQKADALPPALAEVVAKIDLPNMPPEIIANALQGKGETAPAVQAIIVALADPAVRAELPAQTISAVTAVMARQPDLVPSVATQVVVQSLETAVTTMKGDTPQTATVTQIIRDLSTGTQTIATLPASSVATVTAALPVQNTVAATAMQVLTQPVVGAGSANLAQAASISSVLPAVTPSAVTPVTPTVVTPTIVIPAIVTPTTVANTVVPAGHGNTPVSSGVTPVAAVASVAGAASVGGVAAAAVTANVTPAGNPVVASAVSGASDVSVTSSVSAVSVAATPTGTADGAKNTLTTPSVSALQAFARPSQQQQTQTQGTAQQQAAASVKKDQANAAPEKGATQAMAKLATPAGAQQQQQQSQQGQGQQTAKSDNKATAKKPEGETQDAKNNNAKNDSGSKTIYTSGNNDAQAAVNAALLQAQQVASAQLQQQAQRQQQLDQRQRELEQQRQRELEQQRQQQKLSQDAWGTKPDFGAGFKVIDFSPSTVGSGTLSFTGGDSPEIDFGGGGDDKIDFSSPCSKCSRGSCAGCFNGASGEAPSKAEMKSEMTDLVNNRSRDADTSYASQPTNRYS